MSPTGQIGPAIRFDRGVSFRARAFQQGPLRTPADSLDAPELAWKDKCRVPSEEPLPSL